MEGTNDVVFTDITIPSAAFNLREMVRKCLAAGVFPAIATIIPRLDWFGTQTLVRDRILSLNASIRQIAADMSVPLVDMYAAFNTYPAGSGGVLSLLSGDLKHPSDKGYQFMAETWFSAIRMFPFPPVNVSLVTLVPEKTSPERVWARPGASPRKPREATRRTQAAVRDPPHVGPQPQDLRSRRDPRLQDLPEAVGRRDGDVPIVRLHRTAARVS